MLRIYDTSRTFVRELADYTDLCIESELANGDKTLTFKTRLKPTEILNEYYVETDTDWYVVKEVKPSETGTEYVAKLDLEDLEANVIPTYAAVNATATEAATAAVTGTGWTVSSTMSKIRSVAQYKKTPYEILMKIRDAFMCEIWFDTQNKVVHLDPELGSDMGVYFRRDLNLKDVHLSVDSYDYYTRLIPIGKDGLQIDNEGKNYVENYQYSNKIKTLIWEDSSYEDAETLKADAILKLNELSRLKRSYSADVRDLAKLSQNYSILSYGLGDTIHIVDEPYGIKDDQRIVKMKTYPDDPERNTVELSNAVLSFEEMQSRMKAAADAWEAISQADGSINGIYVHGVQVEDIVDIEVAINDGIDNSETISEMQDGIDNSLTGVRVLYALSTSETVAPETGWSATAPAWEDGKYMWQKTQTVKSDGTTVENEPTCISGATGAPGQPGQPGAKGNAGDDAITITIVSSAGDVFKSPTASTVLTAHVYKGSSELTASQISALGTIKWYKDGGSTAVGTGVTLTVSASSVPSTAVYEARLESS